MYEMALTLKTPPSSEPVSLKEAKNHCRVDDDITNDDSLIRSMIVAARQAAETFTRRQLITATYELRFDGFPYTICPPMPPLISVVSIKYQDTDDAEQTVDSGDYQVDKYSTVGRIRPKQDKSWPSTYVGMGVVVVEYTAGYGARENVPEQIIAAILLIVGHLYEHREDVIVGTGAVTIPRGANDLLYPFRVTDGG